MVSVSVRRLHPAHAEARSLGSGVMMIPFDVNDPPVETPLRDWVTNLLAWLSQVGMKALTVAIIIASCIVIGLVLRLVIRRVVHRIVDSAKSKASVDDTQALERSPLADMR